MKRLFLMLISLLAVISLVACNNENTESLGESSTVSLPETEYDKAIALLKEGKAEEAYKALYVIEDDERAKEALKDFKVVYCQSTYKNSTGTIVWTEEKVYDTKGNLTEFKTTYSDGDCYLYNYEYDEQNRMTKETRSLPKVNVTVEHSYNDKGEVAETKYANENGTIEIFSFEYSYDENGRITCIEDTANVSYDYYSNTETTKHFYDDNGNKIKTVISTRDTTTRTHEYDYDENNRLVEHREIYEGNSSYTNVEKYKYNSDGQKISEEQIYDGSSVVVYFTYDKKGNLTRESVFNYGTTFTTNYSYDEFGCLLKIVEKPDNETTVYSDYKIFYCPDDK